MDDCAIFGEAKPRQHRISTADRYYKGTRVPWVIHDCSGTGCAFCRREKRKFAAAIRRQG